MGAKAISKNALEVEKQHSFAIVSHGPCASGGTVAAGEEGRARRRPFLVLHLEKRGCARRHQGLHACHQVLQLQPQVKLVLGGRAR